MQFPIVREYQTDVPGTNPENKIYDEPRSLEAGIWNRVIVPRHAPFYSNTLKVKAANGAPLKRGKDYQIFRPMARLTALTSKPVSCTIELLNPDITDVLLTYDVVGEFPLIDNGFLQLIEAAMYDDRPVWWDNLHHKPLAFPPILHGHSILYDLVAFQDLIEFLDLILQLVTSDKKSAIELRLDHFLNLIQHYIGVFGGTLKEFLDRHKNSYNSHGLTDVQAQLENVDNFETARGNSVLQGRDDMHLLVSGLKSIISNFGFNSEEFMPANILPISRFGNTNFIPPNIDGSFEGMGSVSETCGITMESDGSLVLLGNRMDGRIRGLYYTVAQTPFNNPKLVYSGYRYTHQRFAADGTTVDRICQGSGDECILVGDSVNDVYYIGVTNGSLNPNRHVYSRLNTLPLLQAVFSNTAGRRMEDLMPYVNVAMMGSWLYIFVAASVGDPADNPKLDLDMRYKHVFRVNISDVQATINVTPVRQYLTYVDADGVQWTNAPYHRWHDVVKDGDGNITRALFTFQQPLNPFAYLGLTCSNVLAAQDPSRPGMYAMKFFSGYAASYFSANFNGDFDFAPELTYDFNPNTNVMTLTNKSNLPLINFAAVPVIPPAYRQIQGIIWMVRRFLGQGIMVLDNGAIATSAAYGAQAFPREASTMVLPNAFNKYGTVARHWGLGTGWAYSGQIPEIMSNPMGMGTHQRALLYTAGVEYILASRTTDYGRLQLYYRAVSGGYAIRPGVNNFLIPNLYSRPLVPVVRKVNAPFGLGGATVSCPGAQIGNYGVEIGQSAFCMGSQKKYFNREMEGTAWPGGVGADDIIMMATHSNRMEANGTVTLVPGIEIMYPAWIVETLKAQVANPAIKDRGRFCAVTICDPTFSPLGNFGWLPITVGVTYCDTYGLPNTDTVYTTFMTINASYAAQGNRMVVTGVSVIDIFHSEQQSTAYQGSMPIIYGSDPENEGAQTSLSSMRTYYYVNPQTNVLDVYFSAGVRTKSIFDYSMCNFRFSYANRATQRWTSAVYEADGSLLGPMAVLPDNGISRGYPWKKSTGGAATIIDGPAYKALLGSVYPSTGWMVYFLYETSVVFNGKGYTLPAASMDLRDVVSNPANKTFYLYAILKDGVAVYEIAEDKRLESPFQVWVGTAKTNASQIITVDRFNVFTIDGHRISELKRGNSIPASSGLVGTEGQIPWLRSGELLP